jgi:nitrate reductase NapE component
MAAQQYVLDGRFALGDMVEQRPYGDFYQCTDQQTGQPALLFISQPTALPTPEMVARARQEIMTIAQLTPGILPVLYLNVLPDQRLFFATVPPPGPTLTARVGQGVLSLQDAVGLLGKISEALQVAAAKGVFHRELEPTNIYLDASGAVYLANFGLARQVAAGVFGNPWFMAPEQVNGADPGLPANIYSLGLIFYYMVTGIPPYIDADPNVLLQRHRHDNPKPPSQARPDLQMPPALDAILAKAVAKEPTLRYPSLATFLQDLQGLLRPQEPVRPVQAAPVVAPAVAPTAPSASASAPVSLTNPKSATPVAAAAMAQQPIVTPVVSAPTPAAPAAAPAAPEPEAEDGDKKSPRRRQKGGFRETLWFKKGEEAKEESAVKADDLMKVEKGTGSISDKEKSLEDRYRDGAEDLSVDDRRKFSVRTGQTGVFQAVRVEDLKAAEQKREIAETVAAQKRKKNSLILGIVVFVLLAGGAVGGWFGYNKFMYKPIFDGTPFSRIEELLKSVKPAPKPQYLLVDKAAAELIADARKAIDAQKLVPAGEEGDGTSAAELLMSAEKKADETQAEALKLAKDHLLRTALSRGYLATRTKELDLLVKVADRLVVLKVADQPAPAALKFQELVVTLRKLKKEEVSADIVELMPVYPLAPFCELPAEEEVKPLFESFKALVAEKRVFEPNDQKVCAVTVLLKLRAAMAAAKKPDKAVVKALPALEKEMTDLLTSSLDAAVKARDWNRIRQGLNASFQLNPQSPRGLEILKELEGKSPPEALELVDASKIQLPK